MQRHIFLQFFLLQLILSCTNEKNNKVGDPEISKKNHVDKHKPPIARAEIYCWCFLDGDKVEVKDSVTTTTIRNCATTIALTSSDLIKELKLFYYTTDEKKINSLKNIFFNRMSSTDTESFTVDNRFLILFKEDNLPTDTIIYFHNQEFILNNRRILKYEFSPLDSVKKIIGINKIDCPDN